LLLANGVPHFVQGISGHPFQTPFAKPRGVGESSPVVNVLWGFLNLAAGFTLLFAFSPKGADVIGEWICVGLARWRSRFTSPGISAGCGPKAASAACAPTRVRRYGARRRPQAGKAGESPQKPTKTKMPSFAFFYFLESGLFKGLRPIQMLFFPARARLRRLVSPSLDPCSHRVLNIARFSDYS
jgi:hypothetical protein